MSSCMHPWCYPSQPDLSTSTLVSPSLLSFSPGPSFTSTLVSGGQSSSLVNCNADFIRHRRRETQWIASGGHNLTKIYSAVERLRYLLIRLGAVGDSMNACWISSTTYTALNLSNYTTLFACYVSTLLVLILNVIHTTYISDSYILRSSK